MQCIKKAEKVISLQHEFQNIKIMRKIIKIFKTGFVLLSAIISKPVFAFDAISMLPESMMSTSDDLEIDGDLVEDFKGSICPIEVQNNQGSLFAQFNVDLRSITIEVTNADGVTYYYNTVSSTMPHVLNISTAGWPSETYTVTFMNGNGSAEGEFHL